jgi:hypothetical protein
MSWTSEDSTGSVGAFGGHQVDTLGTAQVGVKLGKYHPIHEFMVMPDSNSGYDCILGDDFMHPYGLTVEYQDTIVRSKMFSGKKEECIVLQRKVPPPMLQPQIMTIDGRSKAQEGPGSWKQYKKLQHDIAAGAQVAYKVHLLMKDAEADAGSKAKSPEKVPKVVQRVIDKHSGPKGTLCGKIPPHTQAKGFACSIELIEGAGPVNIRQYRLTPLEREELISKVQEFIEKGWIEPSSSSWSSSVLFVPKPGGKLRFCVDFRHLNARTVKNASPIPHQGELLDNLKGAQVFSALDLASGFYQLAMAPESKPVTAFPTPFGLYQWCVMPMGLCNAPSVFQQAMNTILRKHIVGGYCLVYLDDIIIKSASMEEHAKHLDAVLSSLNENNLFCQLPKCKWAQSQLKYLGHLVSGEGVLPDPEKVEALDKWAPPLQLVSQLQDAERSESVKEASSLRDAIATECRKFLGFMNYFNRFIPKYSELACGLHAHTQKAPPKWTDENTQEWEKLKLCLRNATMMYHPDFSLPFHVFSDASTKAIGGVLIQFHDGKAFPVAYVARKLTSAEINYTTTEQEMLAMVYCFKQWRCYLEGSKVLLHTDHEPLTWLSKQERPNRRQARWLEFLSSFRYEVLFVKGDRNVVADALSRMLTPPVDQELELPGDNWPDPPKVLSVLYRGLGLADSRQTDGREQTLSARQAAQRTVAATAVRRVPQAGNRAQVPTASARDAAARATGSCGHPDHHSQHRSGAGGSGRPMESAYHKYILLGGYTRNRAAGGGPSATPSSARIADVTGTTGRQDVGQPTGGERDAQPASSSTSTDGNHTRSSRRRKRRRANSAGAEQREGSAQSSGTVPLKRVRFADTPIEREHNSLNESALHPSTDRHEESEHGNSGVPIGHGMVAGGEPPIDTHPASLIRGSQSPEPDQPAMTSDLEPESDPSLSAYELLVERLFDRVKAGLLSDTSIQTKEQREKLRLREGVGGLLWRDNLLFIPGVDKELRHDILYWHHDVPWCGHLGVQKTLELVQRQFWWPGIATDIKNYVQSCYSCQSDKPDRRRKRPPLTFIEAPDSCWKTLGVDLITDLTPTESERYNAIVVFCCHLSKMVRLIATHTTLSTEGFVELFFKEIFPHYGFPNKIVSDRGPQWNSAYFRALCDQADIRLSLSTAYHPQTNGLVERTNEVVETALRHYVSPDHTDWDKKLPFIEFALNDMYREATGTTPFRMNRITVPKAPFEAVKGRIAMQQNLAAPRAEVTSWVGMSSPSGERTFLQAQEEFARARQSVHWAKCKMKEAHDKQGIVNHHYQPGQWVWLSTKHISLRHPSLRHKFSPKFIGPVKVLEFSPNSSTVLLDLPSNLQIHPRVSVILVKPYKARDENEVDPVFIDGLPEWEVEAIINHNIVTSKSKKKAKYVEFLIQWKGAAEHSWHGFKDCEHCVETVERYLAQCTKGTRAKIYRALPKDELVWLSHTFQREALAK